MVAVTVLLARLITDTESPLLLVTGWETSQVLFRVLLMRTSSAPAPKWRASASVKPVVQPQWMRS